MGLVGGKYEIGDRIGGGGMADVFRATARGAEGFSHQVAIKRIKSAVSAHREFSELFVQEAKISARLSHPNIVQTIDFDRDEDGALYLVMELIDGVDLRTLSDQGKIPIPAACYILSEVLRGLDYAHELVYEGQSYSIIHRDVSPHNIMIGWQGSVKIVDFGIAKAVEGSLVTNTGALKGKVSYMSPEQIHGDPLDGRSDLFALGIIFYEMLTGERLFVAKTEAQTVSRLLTQPIANPCLVDSLVPPEVGDVAMRLLQRDRVNRYLRASDALADLLASPVSTVVGRSELETLTNERFPDRAPSRKTRLSTAKSSASNSELPTTKDILHGSALAMDEAGRDGLGFAAEANAEASRSHKEAANNKRTLTAEPIASDSSPNLTHDGSKAGSPQRPQTKSSRNLLVMAGLVIAMGSSVVLIAISHQSSSPSVALPRPEAFVHEGAENTRSVKAADVVIVDAGKSVVDGMIILDANASEVATDATSPARPSGAVKEHGVADIREVAIDAGHGNNSPSQRGYAMVSVAVKPWALIQIDGKHYGQSPRTIKLRDGRHHFVLDNKQYGKHESFFVKVRAGKAEMISRNWLP